MVRPGASVTLADDHAQVAAGAAELAVLRAALDAVRPREPDRVDHLLTVLHTAEQGATIELASEDVALLRGALVEQRRTGGLGLLRFLLDE